MKSVKKSTKKSVGKKTSVEEEYYVFAFGLLHETEDWLNVKDVADVGKLTDEECDCFYEEYRRRCSGWLDVRLIPKRSIPTDTGVKSRMLYNKIKESLNPANISCGRQWAIDTVNGFSRQAIETAIDIVDAIRADDSCAHKDSQKPKTASRNNAEFVESVRERVEGAAEQLANLVIAVPANITRAGSSSGTKPKRKKLRNEERDKRIYELSLDKSLEWDDITATVNKEFPDFIVDKPAVQSAVKRYAKRFKLPERPNRKSGRRPQK